MVTPPGRALDAESDQFGLGRAGSDGSLDTFDGMLGQQLQDADVLLGAGPGAEALFECLLQLGERRRQLPVAIGVGMVERRGAPPEGQGGVERLEDLLIAVITAAVAGYDLSLDTIST